jgi:hypothetical protein
MQQNKRVASEKASADTILAAIMFRHGYGR